MKGMTWQSTIRFISRILSCVFILQKHLNETFWIISKKKMKLQQSTVKVPACQPSPLPSENPAANGRLTIRPDTSSGF